MASTRWRTVEVDAVSTVITLPEAITPPAVVAVEVDQARDVDEAEVDHVVITITGAASTASVGEGQDVALEAVTRRLHHLPLRRRAITITGTSSDSRHS